MNGYDQSCERQEREVLSFEFRHQPLDLLAASPPPNANLSDFGHADSASKTPAPAS